MPRGLPDDNHGAHAADRCRQHPLSYPSYATTSSDLAPFAVLEGLPTTLFISPAGKVACVHTGQYSTVAALESDIQRYALGAGSAG